ncbi:hypothetical protein [Vibrio alginolyticus]|uniref:hypothetical protein n=1 Tax=Vibrio alginolyticus TaxID=663 RepID=UPI001BD4F017|nr:hypothetical protein [Vibrio alginolyticus]MBT0082773.1 hypothetical protein [Vibrio alginolyticus]MBT0106019.1 hypothetical protein [Vibrio alginolyticus]
MTLPGYSTSVRWTDYKIDTPTFRLTPVEKPDMSPYLFHMTGKSQLLSILSPEGEDVPEEYGFLRASIPEAQGEDRNYDARVVCFTESPVFALDFFRYRSFRRWRDNQMYGLGFDKSRLASLGARPCIYADDELKNDIVVLKNLLEQEGVEDERISSRVTSLINGSYPLLMPLLENTHHQGFMWEREWRYFNEEDNDFAFPYDAIRIVCCPRNEEEELRRCLGGYADHIEFVHSWNEYNEVTNFLNSRDNQRSVPDRTIYGSEVNDYLQSLEEQLENHIKIFNKLSAFKDYVDNLQSKGDQANEAIGELQNEMQQMENEIRRIKDA